MYVISDESDDAYNNADWKCPNETAYILHRFCVSPVFQNKGLGKQILLKIENQISDMGYRSVRLDVFRENPYAQRLYRHNGYEVIYMKRIIVYYSLSGNTEEVVNAIAKRLGCEILRIDTVKEMPKSFVARILVGGGQVAMNKIPEIKPIDVDFSTYDEIFIGTPIWNSKGVPAINAFLSDDDICQKVTGLIITSGGGDIEKCVKALEERIPNVKYQVSLLDRKHKDHGLNDDKIEKFIETINV